MPKDLSCGVPDGKRFKNKAKHLYLKFDNASRMAIKNKVRKDSLKNAIF